MRIKLVTLWLLALSAPGLAEEPRYVFQQINVLVAHHDNRFSLRVWPDGRADMRFPAYAVNAGHYRWQLEPEQLAALDAHFRQLAQMDLPGMEARMRSETSDKLVTVADADLLRLELRDEQRAPIEVLMESPQAWSSVLPDVAELSRLADVQAGIFEWMQEHVEVLER